MSVSRARYCVGYLLLLLIVIAAGCGKKAPTAPTAQPPAQPPKVVIGYIVKQADDPWCQEEWRYAQQCADKYGFELVKLSAADGQAALSAIDALAAKQAQGFVICTPDPRLGTAIVNKAESHRMKVYSVDTQFMGANGEPMLDVPFMGTNSREVGAMVGKALMAELQKRDWDLAQVGVCVIDFSKSPNAVQRIDGAVSALGEAGLTPDQIFKSEVELTDQESAAAAADVVFADHPELKKWLVCSFNDDGVLGALKAAASRKIAAGNVIGIGIGGRNCLAEFDKRKASMFVASIILEERRLGFETTENLYKWIKDGTQPPMDVRTTGTLIDHINFRDVLAKEGIAVPPAPEKPKRTSKLRHGVHDGTRR